MGMDRAFEVFPALQTERLHLRKLELSDSIELYSYFSLEEVTKYYDVETFRTEQEAEELIESLFFSYEQGKQIRWGITKKETNELIGTCGFHSIDRTHSKLEVGYDLHPDYWSLGIMSEAMHRIISYAFEEMDVNRIEAFYFPKNIASKRVLEKNGFQHEGILRKRFLHKGSYLDAVLTAKLKEDRKEDLL
ncbi:GNAT family N-acetyltransferase [Cytobacillus spongiae]|jgi:ribosomal-protein-alanine N-acetyltransferase|uniref:GNAT family N-acetyltransferase n=1 Tax=Cytobacillus spongiae TaxID=2901381 RepID=UPI001F1F2FC3|nr:GNAT family protein [Cytobacillus spongiae]UII55324.1 GNAT family N-acetyltransferase [Cytobacillus spongiae]